MLAILIWAVAVKSRGQIWLSDIVAGCSKNAGKGTQLGVGDGNWLAAESLHMQHAGANARRAGVGLLHVASEMALYGGRSVGGGGVGGVVGRWCCWASGECDDGDGELAVLVLLLRRVVPRQEEQTRPRREGEARGPGSGWLGWSDGRWAVSAVGGGEEEGGG